MFKEIKDSFLLKKAGDEIQIGLTILNAIFSGRILILKAKSETVTCDATILKDLFDNVLNILVLKNPAILL